MIKKINLLVVTVCLVLVSLNPGAAQAQGGLTVISDTVEVDFPGSISFGLQVSSDVNVKDIRLHYTVNRMSHAMITTEIFLGFEPATSVTTGWTWDMRKTRGMPPGSSLEYWWTATDDNGNTVETERVKVHIEDNRYDWKDVTEGKVTVYWYEGDDSFSREILASAQQALERLEEDTGVVLERAVKIYIYAGSDDLRGALIFPDEWTGGVAYSRYGITVIGVAPDNIDWGRTAIAHEFTHLVVGQMTFNPYSDLPRWLDEGLAMNAEGELSPGFEALLAQATEEGKLISVRSISSPFSAFAEEAVLAYAQSYSVVKFLTENYGKDKMFELLSTFKQGSGYDEALLKVYGFDLDGLDALWRGSIIVSGWSDNYLTGAALRMATFGAPAGLVNAVP